MLTGTIRSRNGPFGTGPLSANCGGFAKPSGPTREQARTAVFRPQEVPACVDRRVRRSERAFIALSGALWVGVALALLFMGVASAASLGSALVDFLEADFALVITKSFFKAGPAEIGSDMSATGLVVSPQRW